MQNLDVLLNFNLWKRAPMWVNMNYEFYSNCNSFVSNVIIIIIILMSKKAYCANVHAKRIKNKIKLIRKQIFISFRTTAFDIDR